MAVMNSGDVVRFNIVVDLAYGVFCKNGCVNAGFKLFKTKGDGNDKVKMITSPLIN